MTFMVDDRISRALQRIETAAARIEAAARARPAQANPALERKYIALRKEAGQALEQLDLLIGTLEP